MRWIAETAGLIAIWSILVLGDVVYLQNGVVSILDANQKELPDPLPGEVATWLIGSVAIVGLYLLLRGPDR